jgi:hypothetical protein
MSDGPCTSLVCSNDYDPPPAAHEPRAEKRGMAIDAVDEKGDKKMAADDERTTKNTQTLSPGNYFSKIDSLSRRRRRTGYDLPCSLPQRTKEKYDYYEYPRQQQNNEQLEIFPNF